MGTGLAFVGTTRRVEGEILLRNKTGLQIPRSSQPPKKAPLFALLSLSIVF